MQGRDTQPGVNKKERRRISIEGDKIPQNDIYGVPLIQDK